VATGVAPGDEGSLVVEGKRSNYVRKPDGTYVLAGEGAEGTDPEANVRWLTESAGHIIFSSKKQLEPNAAPSGTETVYDRALGGPTHVVSLLPPNVPLGPGQDAQYQGSSADGSTVVFDVAGAMYARTDNAESTQVAGAPSTFAGASRNGDSVFYTNATPSPVEAVPATLFRFDTSTHFSTAIAPNSVFVNVSEDGSHAYFTSQSALDGAAVAGKDNLYVWDQKTAGIQFVAVLAPQDVNEELSLARWVTSAVYPQPTTLRGRAKDTSRTTPDGSVLIFESRANLTGYDSGGHIEIYHYDAGSRDLTCVSCPAPGVPATGDAALQALPDGSLFSTSSLVHIQNVTDDGRTVFFQTEDPLVPGDVNETWDVYEWKAGQQAYLISSGHGGLPSFLYGMTPSGHDLFFLSNERLVSQDLSTVSSIYDARVGGGFPEEGAEPPCQGDNCQGAASVPPSLAGAASGLFQGPENEKPRRHCRKGSRRVVHKGKARCVKKHRAKRHRRANHHRRAAR
jgi:hypothetical protein